MHSFSCAGDAGDDLPVQVPPGSPAPPGESYPLGTRAQSPCGFPAVLRGLLCVPAGKRGRLLLVHLQQYNRSSVQRTARPGFVSSLLVVASSSAPAPASCPFSELSVATRWTSSSGSPRSRIFVSTPWSAA